MPKTTPRVNKIFDALDNPNQQKLQKIEGDRLKTMVERLYPQPVKVGTLSDDNEEDHTGIRTMLKENKNEITEFIHEVFSTDDPEVIADYVENAESMKLVQEDIKHMKQRLANMKVELNSLKGKSEQKSNKLQNLKEQSAEIDRIMQHVNPDIAIRDTLNQKLQDQNLQYEEVIFQFDIYKHIKFRTKMGILHIQQPIENTRRDLRSVQLSLNAVNQIISRNYIDKRALNLKQKDIEKDLKYHNAFVNDIVQTYIFEVEQDTIFKEVYKNTIKQKVKDKKEVAKKKVEN